MKVTKVPVEPVPPPPVQFVIELTSAEIEQLSDERWQISKKFEGNATLDAPAVWNLLCEIVNAR